MVKLKIARVAAASVASAGLIAGFSGVAFAHNYNGDYGHNHGSNSVTLTDTKTVSKNNVGVNTDVNQNANTGDALSLNFGSNNHRHSHDSNSSSNMGGSATTGNAQNNSSVSVGGTVKNTAKAPAVVMPDMQSQGSNHGNNNKLVVTNTKTVSVNNVDVSTDVNQDANSGDAAVIGGNGGKAVTGNASNSSNVNVSLDVEN